MEEKCETCKYASPEFNYKEHRCVRHAPVIHPIMVSTNKYEHAETKWPTVLSDWWCGDYEQKALA